VEPERRLRRIALDADIDGLRDVDLRADQSLIVGSLALVILTMMARLDHVEGAGIVLSANTADRARLTIAISQDRVAVVDETEAHAETLAADALAIVALRRVAQLHEGRLRIARLGLGGRVIVDLPLVRH